MVANIAADMTGSIYHERQVKELCALHALNNLFQERGFSKQELDQICYSLSPDVWINPHKSLLGLGNYDINVIMAALQRRGREAVWFDKRRDPKCLCLDNIEGFILNVPTEYKLGFVLLPLKRRHWIALKKIHGAFYNLDSKLDSPQLIGKENDLLIYLKDQIDSKEKELFLVVSREIDNNQGWLINTYANKEGINTDHDSITYIEDGYMEMNLKKEVSAEMNENEKSLDNKNSRN
ncbi:josephin-2 isoform X1 [Bombus pyrosoma]|uniref:Josephin-2 n=3 Tax=Pyrobombus TaxID=144703 RepID=A0A6P8LTN2_9HYME|nr:josephin-2 isoform X1 [Bombus vancouverensis nearcticus]XP_033301654.1 josephin-2 isoform X1 [Bombus bifarius]XP_043581896.1 josephin-2 isoform X1 [Bombus pyrosoma]XP_050486551.1 josephin-2 isoform X1 [Bombus huntii]